MKIDINDPRITAFALGELKGRDAIEMARAVHGDARIRAAVDEVRETSCILSETLGDGEVHMLTASQRKAVRSAGPSSVVSEIASARVPLWKKPLVAGFGVAAAVAISLYIVADHSGVRKSSSVVDSESGWDWSQVSMRDLTSPVKSPESGDVGLPASEEVRAVAAAISEDTESYRQEIAKRIGQSDLKKASWLPKLEENDWIDVVKGAQFEIPVASGASSWPWLHRYIDEKNALPPSQSIRIEEMLNHFRYQSPSMLTGGGLVADVAICNTPWNPSTMLLAVHLAADASSVSNETKASLMIDDDRIKRARLLGYAHLKKSSVSTQQESRGAQISRTHGNYVIYELEADELSKSKEPWATLQLGDGVKLPIHRVTSWINASADMRFASVVAATGMLLAGNTSLGELNEGELGLLLRELEAQDAAGLSIERREALELIQKTIVLLEAQHKSDRKE